MKNQKKQLKQAKARSSGTHQSNDEPIIANKNPFNTTAGSSSTQQPINSQTTPLDQSSNDERTSANMTRCKTVNWNNSNQGSVKRLSALINESSFNHEAVNSDTEPIDQLSTRSPVLPNDANKNQSATIAEITFNYEAVNNATAPIDQPTTGVLPADESNSTNKNQSNTTARSSGTQQPENCEITSINQTSYHDSSGDEYKDAIENFITISPTAPIIVQPTNENKNQFNANAESSGSQHPVNSQSASTNQPSTSRKGFPNNNQGKSSSNLQPVNSQSASTNQPSTSRKGFPNNNQGKSSSNLQPVNSQSASTNQPSTSRKGFPNNNQGKSSSNLQPVNSQSASTNQQFERILVLPVSDSNIANKNQFNAKAESSGTQQSVNGETASTNQPSTSRQAQEELDSDQGFSDDDFNFESMKLPSHFKKNEWKNNVSTANNQSPQNQFSGITKKFSTDEKQFIEGEWPNNQLIKLTSCHWTYNAGGKNWTAVIKKQINFYLLTFDESYVARVDILQLSSLDMSKQFIDITRDILKKIKVIKTLEDNLFEEKTSNYDSFMNKFKDISNRIADHLDYAQDFLQVHEVLSKNDVSNLGILSYLDKSKLLSKDFNGATKDLLDSEKNFGMRNKGHFKFLDKPKNLFSDLNKVYIDGTMKHKKFLRSRFTSCGNQFSIDFIYKLNDLPDHKSLYLSGKDITLFADLINATSQFNKPIQGFILNLWDKLLKRLDTLKKLEPLTSPIYSYLCKSFLEIVKEINILTNISIENLIQVNNGQWTLLKNIKLPSASAHTYSLESQYRFIFKLMKHFEPGQYSEKTPPFNHIKETSSKFSRAWNLITGSREPSNSEIPNSSEERKVWLYILDNSIQSILSHQNGQPGFSKESNLRFLELTDPLMKCYTEFVVNAIEDRFESFRITVHIIAKFIAQISPYLFKVNTDFTMDQKILEKQANVIRTIMSECHENDNFADQFMSLIKVYNDYWEYRETIVKKKSELFAGTKLGLKMESISKQLLEIVDTALGKEVTIKVQINYFRA